LLRTPSQLSELASELPTIPPLEVSLAQSMSDVRTEDELVICRHAQRQVCPMTTPITTYGKLIV
jgi:hypothetical protein